MKATSLHPQILVSNQAHTEYEETYNYLNVQCCTRNINYNGAPET